MEPVSYLLTYVTKMGNGAVHSVALDSFHILAVQGYGRGRDWYTTTGPPSGVFSVSSVL